jgi:hypothetical protein
MLRAVDTGIINVSDTDLAFCLFCPHYNPLALQLSLAVQESEEKLRREREPEIDVKGKQRAV